MAEDLNFSDVLSRHVIVSKILPKLPTESLLQFKCVSKEWCHNISKDPTLKKAHAHNHTSSRNSGKIPFIDVMTRCDKREQKLVFISAEDHRVVREFETPKELKCVIFEGISSTNGLVLVTFPVMLLCNPTIGEFRVLPTPLEESGFAFVSAIGFDEESDNHKVVQIISDRTPEAWMLDLQVFSKKAGSWKKLQPLTNFVTAGVIDMKTKEKSHIDIEMRDLAC